MGDKVIDYARAEQSDILGGHRCVNAGSSAGGLASGYIQKRR